MKKKIGDDQADQVRQMVEEKKSDEQIGAEYGCGPHAVYLFRRQHAIPRIPALHLNEPLPTYEENGITVTVCPTRFARGVKMQSGVRPGKKRF